MLILFYNTEKSCQVHPLYQVQLNCYAYLAQKYWFKPVTKLSLVYCQPNEDLDNDQNFKLGFKSYPIEVALNLNIVPELLLMARNVLNQSELPQARHNCKGICRWMEKAFKKIPNKF